MMKKESVQRTLEQLPDEFHLEELIERLIVIAKIEEALEDSRMGRVHTHEEVVKRFLGKNGNAVE
jgi:predicted transcriptional regulator